MVMRGEFRCLGWKLGPLIRSSTLRTRSHLWTLTLPRRSLRCVASSASSGGLPTRPTPTSQESSDPPALSTGETLENCFLSHGSLGHLPRGRFECCFYHQERIIPYYQELIKVKAVYASTATKTQNIRVNLEVACLKQMLNKKEISRI